MPRRVLLLATGVATCVCAKLAHDEYVRRIVNREVLRMWARPRP